MKKSPPFKTLGLAVLAAALVALALYVFNPSFAQQSTQPAPVFSHAALSIRRADGTRVPFDVELALTPEQAEYGLMYRRALPENAGMLFLWTQDQPVGMWMKNTYIPLEMLCVKGDGTIVKIAHAVPFDLTPIFSPEPVRGVIEINGGTAARQGLKTGDKVLYPGFGAP
jgi:uncharacterized membrane protein (UPF0127 family)